MRKSKEHKFYVQIENMVTGELRLIHHYKRTAGYVAETTKTPSLLLFKEAQCLLEKIKSKCPCNDVVSADPSARFMHYFEYFFDEFECELKGHYKLSVFEYDLSSAGITTKRIESILLRVEIGEVAGGNLQITVTDITDQLVDAKPPEEKPSLKPHVFSKLVNELRSTAHQFGQHQSIRDRIARVLGDYINLK